MAFEKLVEQYYSTWFRFHPESAVAVGVPGYEGLLTPYSDDEIGALISLNESLLSSLQEIEMSSLSAEQEMDYTILYSAAANELHELLERDWRYRDPEAYLPFNAIHQLLTRPVSNLHSAIKNRLQSIPSYLRGARVFLSENPADIPRSWVESAIEQIRSGIDFIRNLNRHPIVMKRFDNPDRMHEYCEEASRAITDYIHFLERDILPVAEGEFAIGKTDFERRLKEVHFLDISADTLYDFGEQLVNDTRQSLGELLQGQTLQQRLLSIQKQHPAADNVLDAYRESMNRALAFIEENDLVTLPARQKLTVVETPRFLRHEIPFAAYDDPTRSDPEQHGYYYVTVPEDEESMLEHNLTSIGLTSVHEAFPGHHLQFATANLSSTASSLVRVLNPSATLYEGWALYCEQLMVEQGFLGSDDHQVIMLRDRLWRALRVMIDVSIHTRGMTIDEAVKMMCDELGFEEAQARGELNWYSMSPTIPMSYAVGWCLINRTREIQQQQNDFNLKRFHDQVISCGSVSLPLVIRNQFGDDAWQQLKSTFRTEN